MISPSGPMTAHATGPHAQAHSETGRHTNFPVFPEGIHFVDTVVFSSCLLCLF